MEPKKGGEEENRRTFENRKGRENENARESENEREEFDFGFQEIESQF